MRNILLLICLAIASISLGQTKAKLKKEPLTIDKNLVSQIRITNGCSPLDSCQFYTYTLTDSMTDDLIDRLNHSKSEGPCKFIVRCWVRIDYTDGTFEILRSSGSSIKKEDNDWCYDIGDSDLLEELWNDLFEKNKVED